MSAPLLRAQGLRKVYSTRTGLWSRAKPQPPALDGVDLEVAAGESLAIVGESGSGKTTLGRILVRLLEPTAGEVWFGELVLTRLRGEPLRRLRRHFQMVFQDPVSSLNPRLRVGTAIGEPIAAHGLARDADERRRRVATLLEQVGLPASAAERYPHQLSGGQRQRVAIARALACEPQLLVADEPVSALDVSIQAQIINLLADLQGRLGLALVLISHDLAVVEQIADRIVVLYRGRVVEEAATATLLAAPRHPYTAQLLAAVPVAEPGRRPQLPSGEVRPAGTGGCAFRGRCPRADAECDAAAPALTLVAPGHRAACFHPEPAATPPAPGVR